MSYRTHPAAATEYSRMTNKSRIPPMCCTLKRAPLLLPLFLLLSGCAVGPNYARPKVVVPPAFRGAEGAAQQASLADLPWWEVFKDDRLKELIKTALSNNYDLAIAATRVEQSRQVAAQAKSQYFPAIGYEGIATAGKNQFVAGPSNENSGTQGFLLGVANASWEIDLWGRIRRLNEAAKAQYLATQEARRGVMLSLVSDVSEAYFRLLGLQRQLEIGVETVNSFDQTRTLFTQRQEGGVSCTAVACLARAPLRFQATASRRRSSGLQRQIALTENQISVLLGRNPGPTSRPRPNSWKRRCRPRFPPACPPR